MKAIYLFALVFSIPGYARYEMGGADDPKVKCQNKINETASCCREPESCMSEDQTTKVTTALGGRRPSAINQQDSKNAEVANALKAMLEDQAKTCGEKMNDCFSECTQARASDPKAVCYSKPNRDGMQRLLNQALAKEMEAASAEQHRGAVVSSPMLGVGN